MVSNATNKTVFAASGQKCPFGGAFEGQVLFGGLIFWRGEGGPKRGYFFDAMSDGVGAGLFCIAAHKGVKSSTLSRLSLVGEYVKTFFFSSL
jgi:hypothetical protein